MTVGVAGTDDVTPPSLLRSFGETSPSPGMIFRVTAPIRILSSMATKRLLGELVAAYEANNREPSNLRSGSPITVESMGGVDAAKRVAAGEPYDVAVLASGALEKLIAQGHIVAG